MVLNEVRRFNADAQIPQKGLAIPRAIAPIRRTRLARLAGVLNLFAVAAFVNRAVLTVTTAGVFARTAKREGGEGRGAGTGASGPAPGGLEWHPTIRLGV